MGLLGVDLCECMCGKKIFLEIPGQCHTWEKWGVTSLAYRLELPLSLPNIYDIFHVSQLRRHIPNPTHEIRVETIKLKDNLTYPESPKQILDLRDLVLRKKVIHLVKIQWRNHTEEE